MFQNLYLNRLIKLAWLVMSVLMVTALLAPPVYADERETSIFDPLRADIRMLVPKVYQPSFLAKVEEAELLLPPSPCVPPEQRLNHYITTLREPIEALFPSDSLRQPS